MDGIDARDLNQGFLDSVCDSREQWRLDIEHKEKGMGEYLTLNGLPNANNQHTPELLGHFD